MPFLPQPSPFIWAWDRHQETQKCASNSWVSGKGVKQETLAVDAKYSTTKLMEEKKGIRIVLREKLAESVLEVKRVSDRLMAMKLDVNGSILNIVSAYAPQVNNIMEEKNDFWEDLDGLIERI